MNVLLVTCRSDCYLLMVCQDFFICVFKMVASNTSELTIVLTSGNKSNEHFHPLATSVSYVKITKALQ